MAHGPIQTKATCKHDGTTHLDPSVPKTYDESALYTGAGVTMCCGAHSTISMGVHCCRCCYYEV